MAALDHTNDYALSKLRTKYGAALFLGDGMYRWRADNPTAVGSLEHSFYRTALTALAIPYSASEGTDTLAWLYWKNVTL